ncbi:restriction endonuclease subunit S [Staphylococcus aureus]|nr:restriction endonuclease subunit S [Staphylococcus aureus]MCD0971041.1 restriction endonuclease subunit S [Staphylococcus aureus]MCD0993358.1 restriction endonuclease subunit S [Staphylococcus aureus]
MIEQTNTPKLRFPEFKNEWSYDLLSDVVTNKSKKFDPKKEEATKDIELDSIEQNTGRLLDTYISNDFTSQKNKFKKGNVLYSKLRPYLNKYYYAIIDGVCSSEIWVLNTLNKDVLVNKFLYYFIQTNRFSSVTNKSAGSKMPRADWELVKNIRLYKGSIKEQEKIGYFFSKLDRHIELEEEKLELLEQQKRGYMQKIFSQKLRFKDENGDEYPEWKSKKLKDIANVYQPQNLSQNNFQKKGYPVYGANGVIGYYKDFNHSNMEIAVACRGNTCGRVNLTEPKSWITSNAMVVDIIDEMEIEFYFLYQYLRIINYSNVISGSGQPQITRKNMNSVELLVPNYIEQQKIGNLFRRFDDFIEKQSQKIDLLKERKKGFLQKMFI